MKWVQRCKNAEHFACLVSTCTNGHLVQKSTAVVFLRGHMNSWGQNFLQQGPFHLEQAFSAMSDAVSTKPKILFLPILLSERDST